MVPLNLSFSSFYLDEQTYCQIPAFDINILTEYTLGKTHLEIDHVMPSEQVYITN